MELSDDYLSHGGEEGCPWPRRPGPRDRSNRPGRGGVSSSGRGERGRCRWRSRRFHAKDLIGLLLGHFAAARRSPPRCRVSLRVVTPAGCRRSRYAARGAQIVIDFAQRRDKRVDVETSSASPDGDRRGRAAHFAAVMIELHFDLGRAHARGLPLLFCVRSVEPAGPNGSQPSKAKPAAPSGIATVISPRRPRNTAGRARSNRR